MTWKQIVVGTDGSETADRAVAKATLLASKVGGHVTLVCAAGRAAIPAADADAILQSAGKRVADAGVECDTVIRDGAVEDVVLAVVAEREADLIVLGNVGMGKARRLGFGPVQERIAREAPCDVLFVYTKRARETGGLYNRILVGTDGSPNASEAARKAFDLGMMFGIGVTLVYVAGDKLIGGIVLEQTLKAKPRGLGVETRLVEGDPGPAICAVAEKEGIGLVVVGNKGMTGAKRLLLGSVPSAVAHAAPTDVLIAKTVERTVAQIAPGSGALVNVDGKKLAVYKWPDGELTALSPKCRHMGCTVDWNGADATWDCPCHGSRYDKDGRVIHGPAGDDLVPGKLT